MVKRLILSLIFVALLITPCFAWDLKVCMWTSCPQDTGVYKSASIQNEYDIEIFKAINLNGETNYVMRPKGDGGSGFGFGVGTTLVTIKQFIDIDVKYLKMANNGDNLPAAGIAVSVPDLVAKLGINWPFPKFVVAKFGAEGVAKFVSMSDNPKTYLGFYAKILQATF